MLRDWYLSSFWSWLLAELTWYLSLTLIGGSVTLQAQVAAQRKMVCLPPCPAPPVREPPLSQPQRWTPRPSSKPYSSPPHSPPPLLSPPAHRPRPSASRYSSCVVWITLGSKTCYCILSVHIQTLISQWKEAAASFSDFYTIISGSKHKIHQNKQSDLGFEMSSDCSRDRSVKEVQFSKLFQSNVVGNPNL